MADDDLYRALSDLLVQTEELHRDVDGSLTDWLPAIEASLAILQFLERVADDHGTESLPYDLLKHGSMKLLPVVDEIWERALKLEEGEDEEARRDLQGGIARLIEVRLLLLHRYQQRFEDRSKEIEALIPQYADYQRSALRRRAKPLIAKLVQDRQNGLPKVANEDSHEELYAQYHAPVITEVLTQAAALLHPLQEWQSHLPLDHPDPLVPALHRMCSQAMSVLDEQTQTLVTTVSDWFWQDRPTNAYMDPSQTTDSDLAEWDSLVEEIAWGCQVMIRYQLLVSRCNLPTPLEKVVPEWTRHYAVLEANLTQRQWQVALQTATPVTIVIGSQIQVPSLVEDAQYLSRRALERASSTMATESLGTVAHTVVQDLWSNEDSSDGGGSLYRALVDQIGCWSDAEEKTEVDDSKQIASPPSSAFATALLDALDEDLKKSPPPSQTPSKPPTSGGFLSSLALGGAERLDQIQIETRLCALNGTHAAVVACRAMSEVLVSFLESTSSDDKAAAMVDLARQELQRLAVVYEQLLDTRLREAVLNWCGPTEGMRRRGFYLDDLALFLESESYDLDDKSLAQAENDERLDRGLVAPFSDSKFLQQLPDRCEPEVLELLGRAFAEALSETVLQVFATCKTRFSSLGALLLSKQARLLRSHTTKAFKPASSDAKVDLLASWERFSQVVTLLQLERPTDWSLYQSTSVLLPDEVHCFMSLRTDFSQDAIATLVAGLSPKEKGARGASETQGVKASDGVS